MSIHLTRSPHARGPRAFLIVAAFAPLFIATTTQASDTTVWRHASTADFEAGTGAGITIGGRGELELGRKLELFSDLKVGAVWKLARDSQGRLIAATSSPARVVRVNDKGEAEDLLKIDEGLALSLLARPDGSLFVGLGPPARIMKITPDGKTETFAKIDGANYVWDLETAPNGDVFAALGGDAGGRVARFDRDGRETLVCKSGEHAMSLAWSKAHDSLFVGGDDGTLRQVSFPGDSPVVRPFEIDRAFEVFAVTALPQGGVYYGLTQKDGRKPSNDALLQNRVGAWRPGDAVGACPDDVHALLPWGDAGELLIGTAPKGALRVVVPDGGPSTVIGRVDAEQIVAFEGSQEDVFLGTANTGKIYRLAGRRQPRGEYASKPIDAGLKARFGAVSCVAETPSGASVTIAVRSGDTAVPDETWSPWSQERASGEAADVPAARYLQYRLTLATTDPKSTPVVRSVTVRGRTINLPPTVTEIGVPHIEDADGQTRQDKVKLTWKASDPNKDELRFTLAFRQIGWDDWVTLPEELKGESYDWDASALPAGVYIVRLTASDRATRAPEEAASGSLESAPFVVDHEAPKLSIQAPPTPVSPRVVLTAQDDLTPIVRAAYSLDGGAWTAIFPRDGLFDQPREEFQIELEKVSPGKHLLVMRATDAAGFVGSTSVVFNMNGARIDPRE